MNGFDGTEGWYPLADIAERTVTHAFLPSVHRCPDKVAVLDDDEQLTYAQLDESARRVAAGLRALGVEHGTFVLTMMGNHVDNVVTWFALSYLGAVSVPVNTAFAGDTLAYMFDHSKAPVAIVDEQYLDAASRANAVAGAAHTLIVRGTGAEVTVAGLRATAATVEPEPLAPWDLHSVMYTSGTTSMPKGVLVPHALTYTRAAIYQRAADVDTRVELSTLPLFHVVGQCRGVLGPLLLGGTSVLRPRFSASAFWADCRRFGVTDAGLMGAMAQFLLAQPPSERDREHPVRAIHAAAADLSQFGARFGVEVGAAYGMTEIGTITQGDGATPGSCGYVHHEVEHRLVDDHDVPVAPGEPGELVVRSKLPWTFTTGYLHDPAASVELWRNLWLHTGDVFREQADGELMFVGRKKFVIRRRGENISPAQVETALLDHPGIAEAAVVGVPSTDGEEEVLAVVVPVAEIALPDLLAFLADRLPYFMVPRYLEVRTALPKTPTHKVDVGTLRAAASTEHAWDREAHGISVTRTGLAMTGGTA